MNVNPTGTASIREAISPQARLFPICLAGILILLAGAAVRADSRTWTSTVGTTIDAEYAGRAQGRVKLRKADGNTIEVPLYSLSPADQSWVLMKEARGGTSDDPKTVPQPPDKLSETLPVLKRGDASGYHTYVEMRHYDAGLDEEGQLHIYLKEKRSRTGEPLRVYMDCFTRNEDIPYRGLPVVGYFDVPDPEKNPDTLTLHGVLERNVPFTLTLRFTETGITFEAQCNDPDGLEPHTTLRVRARIPGVPPAEEIIKVEERRELLKGWQVVSSPRKGKDLTYAYAEVHESMGGLNERIAIDAPVYGRTRIVFAAPEPKVAWLVPNPLPGYRGMQLWKGFTVSCTKSYTEDNPKPLLFEINLKEEL